MRCKCVWVSAAPRVLWWDGERRQNYGVIFSVCKSQQSLYPLGIVKGRRRQTQRKYPINLQDISCEAPFRTGDDVTLGASMSKCHDKLLHINPCFYLMIALFVWVVPFFQTVINNVLRSGQETHGNTQLCVCLRLAHLSEWKWHSKSVTHSTQWGKHRTSLLRQRLRVSCFGS